MKSTISALPSGRHKCMVLNRTRAILQILGFTLPGNHMKKHSVSDRVMHSRLWVSSIWSTIFQEKSHHRHHHPRH